jgi:hypothetical protein
MSYGPAGGAPRLQGQSPRSSANSIYVTLLRGSRSGCRRSFRFDELRLPANLALRVTITVIYPAAPARSRIHSFGELNQPGDLADLLLERLSGQLTAHIGLHGFGKFKL